MLESGVSMYEKCLACPKLGVSCDGPNFMAMNAQEVLDWCRKRKTVVAFTNSKLAELSGVPLGTINRLFSGDPSDFKYETVRPILRCLIGGSFHDNPCPPPEDGDKALLLETIEHMKERSAMQETERARMERSFKRQIKIKRFYIVLLGASLAAVLLLVIAALIYDKMNPGMGYIW